MVKTSLSSAVGAGALVRELSSHTSLSAKKTKYKTKQNKKPMHKPEAILQQSAQTLKMVHIQIKWIKKKPEGAQYKCEDVLPCIPVNELVKSVSPTP